MTDLSGRKPILCLDFDGVCHQYSSGWKGPEIIPDPPVDGLFEFLSAADQVFEINIFSSRSAYESGIAAMRHWFITHYTAWYLTKFPNDSDSFASELAFDLVAHKWKFPKEKPPAFVGIDDRVVTFTGRWPSVEALKNFQPWNKRTVDGKELAAKVAG